MSLRKALVVLTLLWVPAVPAWADLCVGAVLSSGEATAADRVLDAYRRLVTEAGLGLLTEQDLRALRGGGYFELDPQGRAETIPVVEGLSALGNYVREIGGGSEDELLARLKAVLDRQIESMSSGKSGATRAIEDRRAVADLVRNISVPDDTAEGTWTLSADGRRLAQGRSRYHPRGKRLRIFETDTGKVLVDTISGPDMGDLFLDPNGKRLASFTLGQPVRFWELPTTAAGTELAARGIVSLDDARSFVGFVEGGSIALIGYENGIRAVRVDDGSIVNEEGFPGDPRWGTVSPDGKRLAVANNGAGTRENLFVYDDTLWKPRPVSSRLFQSTEPIWKFREESLEKIAWDVHGRLYTARREEKRGIVTVRRPDFTVVQTLSYPGVVQHWAISPDGTLVAASDTAFHGGNPELPWMRVRRVEDGVIVDHVPDLARYHQIGFAGPRHLWVRAEGLSLRQVDERRVVYGSDPMMGGPVIEDLKGARLIETVPSAGVIRVWNLKQILEEFP